MCFFYYSQIYGLFPPSAFFANVHGVEAFLFFSSGWKGEANGGGSLSLFFFLAGVLVLVGNVYRIIFLYIVILPRMYGETERGDGIQKKKLNQVLQCSKFVYLVYEDNVCWVSFFLHEEDWGEGGAHNTTHTYVRTYTYVLGGLFFGSGL